MTDHSWITLTRSGIVSKTPAVCGSVLLTANGLGNGVINLYDGESTNDPLIVTIRSWPNASQQTIFQPFLVTKRGLYIDFTAYVENVLVQLATIKE